MKSNYFRVLGIDPGSRNLGYSTVDILLNYEKLYDHLLVDVEVMGSLLVDQIVRRYEDRWFGYTERHRRLKSCGIFVHSLCRQFSPDMVVIEDAYLNRRQPTSYRSLSEGIVYLEDAIRAYDDTLPMMIVEPSVAKRAVGAKMTKTCDKKLIVREAIKNNKSILLPPDFDDMTEHAVDSLALGFTGCKEWWEENRFYY